jgi:hypothetical protein
MNERIESLGALDRSTHRSRHCIFVCLEDGAPLLPFALWVSVNIMSIQTLPFMITQKGFESRVAL